MNHRVFERKWRSRSSREHVCLSVCFPSASLVLARFEVLSGGRHPLKSCTVNHRQTGAGEWLALWSSVRLAGTMWAFCTSTFGPQIRRDHLLNLSISISRGKETNKDSPSNGERSGKSSSLKSLAVDASELWLGEAAGPWPVLSKLTWKGTSERVTAPCTTLLDRVATVFRESGCLGMQPKVGGKLHLKLNTGMRPIANKYREGKVKSTLKRESKRPRNR